MRGRVAGEENAILSSGDNVAVLDDDRAEWSTPTCDALGPLGAKSMSESPFLPVAPALANAVRDATGIRFGTLPLTRDHVCLTITRESAGRAPAGG